MLNYVTFSYNDKQYLVQALHRLKGFDADRVARSLYINCRNRTRQWIGTIMALAADMTPEQGREDAGDAPFTARCKRKYLQGLPRTEQCALCRQSRHLARKAGASDTITQTAKAVFDSGRTYTWDNPTGRGDGGKSTPPRCPSSRRSMDSWVRTAPRPYKKIL